MMWVWILGAAVLVVGLLNLALTYFVWVTVCDLTAAAQQARAWGKAGQEFAEFMRDTTDAPELKGRSS